MDDDRVRATYPLHYCVWMDNHSELRKALDTKEHNIEKRDPRGRTPLLLAVSMDRVECARILLKRNANINAENRDGFSVFHEAVCSGDRELIQEILQRRDQSRTRRILEILRKIRDTRDFYVEMKWKFSALVPGVSGFLPSATYKIFKSGSNVRIDTTSAGGDRSLIFNGQGDRVTIMEIDHAARKVYVEQMKADDTQDVNPLKISMSFHLKNPIVVTLFNTDKMHLERNHTGFLGMRSREKEVINGYTAKLLTASNLKLVAKKRTEHLTRADKARHESTWTPLLSWLGAFGGEGKVSATIINAEYSGIRLEDYFDPKVDLRGHDVGYRKEMFTKVQIFEEKLWLCENFPLSFPEQLEPIIDLMAIRDAEFAKLRYFMRLPCSDGFPLKIETPIFGVLSLSLSFENIFGRDHYVPGVTRNGSGLFHLEENCFEAPHGYARLDSDGPRSFDKNDKLFQDAIRQLYEEAASVERPTASLPFTSMLQSTKATFARQHIAAINATQEPNEEGSVSGSFQRAPQDGATSTDEAEELLEERKILERALRMSLAERREALPL